MHKKFIFLLSASIAYGATPASSSGVSLVGNLGGVSAYAVNISAAMNSFREEINPVTENMQQIADILDHQTTAIKQNISQRFQMLSNGTLTMEYDLHVTACTIMGNQMGDKMAELEQCKSILEGKLVHAPRNFFAEIMRHPDAPRVTDREQRLVKNRGKKR